MSTTPKTNDVSSADEKTHSQLTASDQQIPRRDFLRLAGVTGAASWAAVSGFACAQVEADKRVKVAIIGHTGQGGYGHSLDEIWGHLPETVLVGIADADADGRNTQAVKFPQVKVFSDYKKMLEELKPDLVVVAPRYLGEHRDMILAAAQAGARGIYCEKPYCRTPAEADEIVSVLESTGCKLAIAHRNRFNPVVEVVQEAVKAGKIGDLLEVRTRGKEDHRGGGLDLWVLASHTMDMAIAFTGQPTQCSADVYVGNRLAVQSDVTLGDEEVGPIIGDRIHARFETESGVPIFFESVKGKGVPSANFGVRLVGNDGLIDLRIDVDPLAQLLPGNPFRPPKKTIPWTVISSAGIGQPEPVVDLGKQVAGHLFAVRDLLSAMNENRRPLSNELTGRTVVEMNHAIFASHLQNGGRVPLPLTSRQHALAAWSAEGESGDSL